MAPIAKKQNLKGERWIDDMKTSGGESVGICTVGNVVELAHEIWVAEGRPEGQDVQHWLEAEAMLKHADSTLIALWQENPRYRAEDAADTVSEQVAA